MPDRETDNAGPTALLLYQLNQRARGHMAPAILKSQQLAKHHPAIWRRLIVHE